MRMKWLAILAVLLLVACESPKPESGNTTGGNNAVQEKQAPGDDSQDAASKQEDVKEDADKPAEKKDDNSFDGEKVGQQESTVTDQDVAAKKYEPSLAELFAKIDADLTKANNKFRSQYRSAKQDDKAKLAADFRKSIEKLSQEAMKLAKDNLDNKDAIDGLAWVAKNGNSAQVRDEAVDLALEKFSGSSKLAGICQSLSRSQPSQEIEDKLKKILASNQHDEVQAAATYGLTKLYGSIQRAKAYAESNEKFKPGEYVTSFDMDSVDIEGLYETLAKDYPDMIAYRDRTYGDVAKGALFEMRNLRIGAEAPDIVGKDFDGQEFKLSEYRGKVVVLDFWGDW